MIKNRIHISVADCKEMTAIDVIESYIEFGDRIFTSVQIYQSEEVDNDAGVKRDFYRSRKDVFRTATVIGLHQHYYNDDDAWGVKISMANGDYLLYIIPTEAEAKQVFEFIYSQIFPFA